MKDRRYLAIKANKNSVFFVFSSVSLVIAILGFSSSVGATCYSACLVQGGYAPGNQSGSCMTNMKKDYGNVLSCSVVTAATGCKMSNTYICLTTGSNEKCTSFSGTTPAPAGATSASATCTNSITSTGFSLIGNTKTAALTNGNCGSAYIYSSGNKPPVCTKAICPASSTCQNYSCTVTNTCTSTITSGTNIPSCSGTIIYPSSYKPGTTITTQQGIQIQSTCTINGPPVCTGPKTCDQSSL